VLIKRWHCLLQALQTSSSAQPAFQVTCCGSVLLLRKQSHLLIASCLQVSLLLLFSADAALAGVLLWAFQVTSGEWWYGIQS
jgi:hypothetical protein